MAALLVALAVMAVLMSVALPVWRHDAQREKEEELVFRGQQYVRAIRLFQTKNQTLPTSVDILVQGRYIRKKFKDPITNEDFIPIGPGTALPGQNPSLPGVQRGQPGGSSSIQPGPTSSTPMSSTFSGGTVPGGMMGVVSKSKEESIRLFQGRNHYNEWTFLFVNQGPAGAQPGGRGVPGGPGGQPLPGNNRRGGPGGGGPGGGGSPTTGSPFPFPGGGGSSGSPFPFPGGGRGVGPGSPPFPPGSPGRGVGPGGQPFPPGTPRRGGGGGF
jgi:type II secretory pathway pseudopilin PulG